jgi:hypothetical protein
VPLPGINRALHENQHFAKLNAASEKPCIFLSHISVDKPSAIAVGKYIMNHGGIDVYLDINDEELQHAVDEQDHARITQFIERGVSASTHIMCLVSADTVKSWWVPYELGFAKCAEKGLATLKLKGDVSLPAYLSVSKIIRGTESLNNYLRQIRIRINKITASTLYETLIPNTEVHPLDNYLDWNG